MGENNSSSETKAGRGKANFKKNTAAYKGIWPPENPVHHPKQRIFLSIDAVGSTQIKSFLATKKGYTSGLWATSFARFLPEVVILYQATLIKLINKHCRGTCANPCVYDLNDENIGKGCRHVVNLWKYAGDEVVLEAALICNKFHAPLHVLALAETIKQLNLKFVGNSRQGKKYNSLRFKGAAWVAGFPVMNIELNLPSSTDGQTVKDFLGPSIDLGFRLSKLASEERLIVSASLATLIAKAPNIEEPFLYKGKPTHHLPLCYGGSVEVKGVTNNSHPLIWYSVNETKESDLCSVNHKKLLAFLRYGLLKELAVNPFIPDDGHVDPKYCERYNKAVKIQRKILCSVFYEPKPPNTKRPTKKRTTSASGFDGDAILKRIAKPQQ